MDNNVIWFIVCLHKTVLSGMSADKTQFPQTYGHVWQKCFWSDRNSPRFAARFMCGVE